LEQWFDRGNRQKDVIDGVLGVCGVGDGARIGRLTGLRDELTHGRGATVQRAPSYLSYLETFKTEPSGDLFLIVRRILLNAVGLV
jgi:hypothetical protein